MNVDCLIDWLKPAVAPAFVCFGPWVDSKPDMRYVSIQLEGGAKPGPASRYASVDIWYVGVANSATLKGKPLETLKGAQALLKRLEDTNSDPSRPFASLVPITGIIGPMTAEGGRHCYKVTIEITS